MLGLQFPTAHEGLYVCKFPFVEAFGQVLVELREQLALAPGPFEEGFCCVLAWLLRVRHLYVVFI